jgi:hypothetical protein
VGLEDAMSERPDWIPDDWLLFSRGYALGCEPPAGVPGAVNHSDPWIRVVAITLAAMSGDFSAVDDLIEIATESEDMHLIDCALRVFSQAGSPASMGRLAIFFDHPEYGVRVTAYQGAMMSAHLPLVRTLAASRVGKDSTERGLIEVRISAMLEAVEEAEFVLDVEEILTDRSYQDKVNRKIQDIQIRHGSDTAIQFGEPLDIFSLSKAIREFLNEEDPDEWGGAISDLLDSLEGMIGISTLGCMDDDVDPIIPQIQSYLSALRLNPGLLKITNGRRSFFGHRVS